ncbi:MAG: hypothetical protein Q8914_11445, partial [Bacteroidota bacterium]|nr:hypothetical protein [Bacteroidota bacterium]
MVHFRGLILLSAVIGLSQPVFSNIPIGTWRTHYSYNNVSQVVSTDDLLYGVANAKLFSVDVKGTVETYSSLTGLNGFDIACIGWNEKAAALLVVYSDGNMDFISKSGIDNLPDFKNKSMTSDKTVYSLRMQNGYAYLSTGVGLLVIDVRSRQIVDTYKPLLNSQTFTVMDTVYDAVSTDDSIFLATPQGLFGGNVSSNLLDPSQWSPLSFPANTAPVSLVLFSGQLTALASNGTVYRKSGNNWIQLLYDNQAQKLISDGNY